MLGHEIGHVVQRHSSQQMAKSQLGQSLVTGVGAAASDRGHGYSAMVIGQVVQQTTQLSYGRERRARGGRAGPAHHHRIRLRPAAMIDVMKVLAEASKGSRTPEWLASHPYPENRIALIQQWLSENPNDLQKLTRGRKLH